MTKEASLTFDELTVRFGGLTAVERFSFNVERGKIFSIIGPNGAGKTTAFNAATGIYQPTEGRVLVLGREPSRPWWPTSGSTTPARSSWPTRRCWRGTGSGRSTRAAGSAAS